MSSSIPHSQSGLSSSNTPQADAKAASDIAGKYAFPSDTVLHLSHARNLDRHDPISHLIDLFEIPLEVIYLDGNSLGPLPISAKKAAIDVVETQWGQDLITSWNKHAWIDLPSIVGDKIAPLVGAAKGQVICCDSISVNLFKLLASALQLNAGGNAHDTSSDGSVADIGSGLSLSDNESADQPSLIHKSQAHKSVRNIVLSQKDNFPTDLYMVEGLAQMLGAQQCRLVTCAADELETQLKQHGHEIAVLMLTHVNFRSGFIHDMQKLTTLAHEYGVLVIWDLAHSAGAVPVELDKCEVDFAVGCGYKYLNGGPGAPAFIYVAQKHIAHIQQPLTGWMGHVNPFTFDPNYTADAGIKKFLSGTPSVISMAVLSAALDMFEQVNMLELRAKSVAMTCFFQGLLAQTPALTELVLASPVTSENRGSQLAYTHPQAYALCQALISHGVIADFRAPDILRFGFSVSFLSFEQLFKSVQILQSIIETKQYKQPQFNKKQAVT